MQCKVHLLKWLSSFSIIITGCSIGDGNHQNSATTIGKSSWMSMTQRDPINDSITWEMLTEALNSKAYLIIKCDRMGLHATLSGESISDVNKLKPITVRIDAGKPMVFNEILQKHAGNYRDKEREKTDGDKIKIPKSLADDFIKSTINHNNLVIRLIKNDLQNLDYYFNIADADREISTFVQEKPCFVKRY